MFLWHGRTAAIHFHDEGAVVAPCVGAADSRVDAIVCWTFWYADKSTERIGEGEDLRLAVKVKQKSASSCSNGSSWFGCLNQKIIIIYR